MNIDNSMPSNSETGQPTLTLREFTKRAFVMGTALIVVTVVGGLAFFVTYAPDVNRSVLLILPFGPLLVNLIAYECVRRNLRKRGRLIE